MGIILIASFFKEHGKFINLSGLLVNIIYLQLFFAHFMLSISILRPQFSYLLPVSSFLKL